MTTVGLVGTGRMGSAMARALRKAGLEATVAPIRSANATARSLDRL